jgi:hypothetical protein
VHITTNSVIQKIKKNKMENKNNTIEPESKKSNDFMKLIIGIVVVIVGLIALKYLANVLGVM